MTIEEGIASGGFDSPEEFYRMIAEVDLSDPQVLREFNLWKTNDGSRTGLERLLKLSMLSLKNDKKT